ncbi:MAG: ATP-binding protein [Planctomycetota bacterium]|nr:ATP-binding protein [Planctomycetota bacterium]
MSVEDTTEGLLNLIRPQAEKRGIELRLKVEPNIRPVLTDASKFQQIVFNFLSNAIKFTPQGGQVTLSASLVHAAPTLPAPAPTPPEGEGHGEGEDAESAAAAIASAQAPAPAPVAAAPPEPRLCVSVSDTGPGIPLEMQERIFEKFTQLALQVTKEHEGTGLGLTICRELTALLQGQIILDSIPGKGATFSLVIPLSLEARSAPLMPDLAEGRSPLAAAPPVVRIASPPPPASPSQA